MRSARLAELPPRPPGKTGWPWTVESPLLPPARPDGSPWPRISIVTPSYNQGQFIEETIRSVLLQGYPDLEYIIIDGGSTDQSVEIIKKYEPWLTYWVSEKDRGQAHAINKGLAASSGKIFQWVNSDDILLISALREIARAFRGYAIAAPILAGQSLLTSQKQGNRRLSVGCLLTGRATFSQPGFWTVREDLNNVGIDEQYHYAFDWEMVIRYLESYPYVKYISSPIIFFRHHPASKTFQYFDRFIAEGLPMLARLRCSLVNPSHRRICREAQHRRNWERHLTAWREAARDQDHRIAARMFWLGIRRPRLRASRFWLGALRRTFSLRIAR
jgi:glycosyltransferase involved in cell wall biosynthesis